MWVTLTESKAANCVSGWVAAHSNLPAQTALASQGKAGQGSKRVPTQVLPSALCLSLLYQLCCFKTATLRKYKCQLPVIFKTIMVDPGFDLSATKSTDNGLFTERCV